MEEKKTTKISLSTFFLILAIIAIIAMGIFIFKLIKDKDEESKKVSELQAQVNSLSIEKSKSQEQNTISEPTVDEKTKNEVNTEVKTQTTTENQGNVDYEISTKNESTVVIKATKDGETVTKEFEMDAGIVRTATMEFSTIGSVAVVEDSAGEYYGVSIYQLANGEIKKLGTINLGADFVNDATYEVVTEGEGTAVITAKIDDKTVKKEFKMDASIAKTDVIKLLNHGKVVLVAESGGEYYGYKVYRFSREKNDILEVGTINTVL